MLHDKNQVKYDSYVTIDMTHINFEEKRKKDEEEIEVVEI